MCELFGYTSNTLVEDETMLKRFFENSTVHRDGWGLYKESAGRTCLYRDSRPAYASSRFQWMLDHPEPARMAIGHIRYATTGSVCRKNVHPFQAVDPDGRLMTLAHNGGCPMCMELAPFTDRQMGTTDSERILLYIIDQLTKVRKTQSQPLTQKQRIRVIDDALSSLSGIGRINVILTDGELFFVRCNILDRLHMSRDAHTVYFSTRPLHANGLNWYDVPTGQTLVYQENRLIYQGLKRGALFHPIFFGIENAAYYHKTEDPYLDFVI